MEFLPQVLRANKMEFLPQGGGSLKEGGATS